MREGRNSAVHYIDKAAIDELQKKILHLNCLTGVLYPLDNLSIYKYTERQSCDERNLAIPPVELRHGYGTDDESYIAGGRHHFNMFTKIYEKWGRVDLKGAIRILDFGCSSGRVIRFFADQVRNGAEAWGCDIDAASIDWCQKNLMPPLKFFTNTTSPHLPFKDGYLDFVYAGSVFTHMNETSAAWIVELSRCQSNGGVAVFTIHNENSLDHIYKYEHDATSHYSKTSKTLRSWDLSRETLIARGNMCFESSAWWLSAWYSTDFFSRLASLGYEVVEIIPDFYGYQTAVVLRKP